MTRKCFVPKGTEEKIVWRYIFEKPQGEWTAPAFDDSLWSLGEGGFGNKVIVRDLGAKANCLSARTGGSADFSPPYRFTVLLAHSFHFSFTI